MHSGIALYQGTQCLLHGRPITYKGALCIVQNSLYKGPLPIVHGGSASYECQIRIKDDEIAPYHRAR